MIGTLARFNVRNALNRFETEKGFFANLLAYKGIENINEMVKNGNIYIISAELLPMRMILQLQFSRSLPSGNMKGTPVSITIAMRA